MASLSVKVYYVENKTTKEIRKFSIDGDVAENFEYLIGKICQVFPDLLRKELELFWKDEEEDYISLSSDDELRQAFHSIPSSESCLKIFVKAVLKNKENFNEHSSITCDECESNINGIRYKCTVCFDYDLCSSCESKGHHPDDHELLCIKKPRFNNSFYVMRSPFGRGCCRGQAPWGYCGRGKFQMSKNHCKNPVQCNEKYKIKCQKTKEATIKHQEHPITEIIYQISTYFGIDPDVAVSQAQSYIDNLNVHSFEGALSNFAEFFNLNPDYVKEAANSLSSHSKKSEAVKKSEEEEGKEIKKNKNVCQMKVDNEFQLPHKLDEIRKDVRREVASNLETYSENNENLSQQFQQSVRGNGENASVGKFMFMDRIIQNCTIPMPKSKNNKEKENRKLEEFVVVGSSTGETDNLTEKEQYDQRLKQAINRMENMGFEEQNGWLRQLLISKDLSIEKVLDALNPSK